MKIILGSASKARQQVLHDLGYEFDVRPAEIDEKLFRHDDLRQLPLLIAQAKSQSLIKQINEHVILITADSVVVYKDELREKPQDEDQARFFLRSYGQGAVEVIAGVVVTNTQTGKTTSGLESGKIYFHKFPESFIEELIQHGRVFEGAGGFIIEDPAMQKYIVHVEGNFDTIMGLPKLLTKKLMEEVL
jgi:septum formation protein